MPEMRLAGPKYKYPVSDQELKRRLDAVQSIMRQKRLDCCIAQSQSTIFDSVVRYLTDTVVNAYGTTLIIPADGKIVMINHGVEADDAAISPSLRNVEKLILKPYCQPFGCTDGMTGKIVCREIKKRGYKRIGVIMRQLISEDLMSVIREEAPECILTDFTKEFSYVKAIKSPEEWELIDKALKAHRKLMDMVPALLRPGRMEYEIIADVERASRYLCCDYIGNIAVGSAPGGSGTFFTQNYSANRRIGWGDGVTVMIEVSGPGGIYCELARTFCLGEANPELIKLYEIARGVQQAVAEAAKPGVTGKELNRIYDDYVTEYGIVRNGRFVGHGQGYDMMEAPVICPSEDMEMKEDMFLAIHPELVLGDQFSICCDNYRITEDGGIRVTDMEQKIFVIDN